VVVGVEVLDDKALVRINKMRGLGGLPVGVSGRVLVLLSGGIDSPVAAWLMAKRGCQVDYIHFHPYPPDMLDRNKVAKIVRLAGILARFTLESTVLLAPCFPATKRLAKVAVCGPGSGLNTGSNAGVSQPVS
jgi:thiamine biosynthesis protein ThiI